MNENSRERSLSDEALLKQLRRRRKLVEKFPATGDRWETRWRAQRKVGATLRLLDDRRPLATTPLPPHFF